MNRVTGFFLRVKHWQLFLLIFGVYCIGQFVAMKSMVTAEPAARAGGFGIPFWVLMMIFGFSFLAWFWAMGSFLSSILRPELRLKLGFFRFALLYPIFYAFFFFKFVLSTRPVPVFVIVPLHLFAMFCFFYIVYFDSKSLVLAEKREPLSFSDYAGPFFLLWFFPIGVWIIQPKINRLYAGNRNPGDSPSKT
ncbi:MAG: hypothetical protein ABSA57_03505 [Candidatus Acidiferrales bacterium]